MQFRVTGQNRQTGGRMELSITADSPAQAQCKATEAGMAVRHVEAAPAQSTSAESADETPDIPPSGSRKGAAGPSGKGYLTRRFGGPADLPFAPLLRVILGLILLAGFGVWAWQNHAAVTDQLKVLQSHSVDPTEVANSDPTHPKVQTADQPAGDEAAPSTPQAGAPTTDDRLGGWNACGAGLLLLLSGLFRGKVLAVVVVLGAAVAVVGPGVTTALGHWALLGIGMGVGLVGIFFFREPV